MNFKGWKWWKGKDDCFLFNSERKEVVGIWGDSFLYGGMKEVSDYGDDDAFSGKRTQFI